MSMNVYYKVYTKNGKNKEEMVFNDVSCFSSLYYNKEFEKHKNGYSIILVKSTSKNIKHINFWVNLLLTIDPELEFFTKNNNLYMKIKLEYNLKFRIITTILRFLWENTNHYDIIPNYTKELYSLYPNIDPLVAVTIANSIAYQSGSGHSLVYKASNGNFKTVDDYNNIKEFQSLHDFFDSSCLTGYKIAKEVEDKLKSYKKEIKTEDRIREYLAIVDPEQKLCKKYKFNGSISFDRRFPWDGEIEKYNWVRPTKNSGNKT